MLDFDKAQAIARETHHRDGGAQALRGELNRQCAELVWLEKRRIVDALRKMGDIRPTDGEIRGFWYRAACVAEDV